ncbi:hypothetical protein C8K44_10146 [Aminobacter sp. AP02]|nr:hypothetical protein C8K44_10146 [Aminobacter sp. AP02]
MDGCASRPLDESEVLGTELKDEPKAEDDVRVDARGTPLKPGRAARLTTPRNVEPRRIRITCGAKLLR